MNNEERDKLAIETHAKMIETHTAVMIMAEKVEAHNKTLYGNGQPGLVRDFTVMKVQQEECPARKATSTENKRLAIATVATIIALLSLATSIIFHIRT